MKASEWRVQLHDVLGDGAGRFEAIIADFAACEKERDEAQRAKYGTPCKCESWIEMCRLAEDRVKELEAEIEFLRGQVTKYAALSEEGL